VGSFIEFETGDQLKKNSRATLQAIRPFPANRGARLFRVDFEVGGTLERKDKFARKVVGRDLKDLVNSFWAEKPTSRKEKRRSPTMLSPRRRLLRHQRIARRAQFRPIRLRVTRRAGGVRLTSPKSGVRPTMDA